MRTQIAFGALAALVVLAAPANTAQVSPDPGTQREFIAKMGMCNQCHGQNGVPVRATIPIIWGQDESYLVKQLHDFRSAGRDLEVMTWAAKTLHEEELAPATAFFAKKSWPAGSAAAAAPTPPPRGIAVCQACHQADFRGAPLAEGAPAPRLAGQSYEYLVESMRQFADGQRKNNDTMAQLMASISPAEREAMARYLSSR